MSGQVEKLKKYRRAKKIRNARDVVLSKQRKQRPKKGGSTTNNH